MTDKNLTEVIAIVDRSGSMNDIRDDAIGGFNTFLKEQQESKEGKCLLTYVQFDNEYEVVHEGIDIGDMKALDYETYAPRGGTALLDAMGQTINVVGARLEATPEEKRPGNVVVVILTDGQENSSREFSKDKIKEMVEHQTEKYDWSFVYLAQNMDAVSSGASIGIDFSSRKAYVGNVLSGGAGVRAAYCSASSAVSNMRYKSVRGQSLDFTDEEKEGMTGELNSDSSAT